MNPDWNGDYEEVADNCSCKVDETLELYSCAVDKETDQGWTYDVNEFFETDVSVDIYLADLEEPESELFVCYSASIMVKGKTLSIWTVRTI